MRFYLFLWSFICCLVYYALICCSLNQSLPRVRTGLQSPIIYPVGANVQLHCPAYDDETDLLFFEWSRGKNEPIEESSRHRLTYKGVLKIKSAIIEDSGVYHCKAINGFGSVTTNVTLQIVSNEDLHALNSPMDNLYPRDDNDYLSFESNVNFKYNYKKTINNEKLEIPQPIEYRKQVGVSVTFNCNARQVRWYKNGEHLSVKPNGSNRNRGVLTFSKVRIKDSGNYTCVGVNHFGHVNNTFHLYVYDNKKPELTGFHPINTTVKVGDTAMFHCKVNSVVKPNIQWLKDFKSAEKLDQNEAIRQGLLRINNEYYRVLKSTQVIDSGNGLYYNNLVIGKTQINDSGNYICFAANSIGINFKGTHLTVLPVITSKDVSSDTSFQRTNLTTIFWLIVSTISIVVILLSLLLYLKTTHQNHVSINNNQRSIHKIVNHKTVKNKQNISKNYLNDWIEEQNSCSNPAYSYIGVINTMNGTRLPLHA